MVCDELWSYDEHARTATLVGTRILCRACDAARHFGFTGIRGYAAEALATLARVNGMDLRAAKVLQRQAMRDFQRRSALRWVVHVEPDLLVRFPELAALEGLGGVPGEGQARVDAQR